MSDWVPSSTCTWMHAHVHVSATLAGYPPCCTMDSRRRLQAPRTNTMIVTVVMVLIVLMAVMVVMLMIQCL